MDELLTPDDVKRIAAERGLSLQDVFKRAGIAHTIFYRWSRGETSPSLTNYQRIVAALDEDAA